MFNLYSIDHYENLCWGETSYSTSKNLVARFSRRELANAYIQDATIRIHPNGGRDFKLRSLLGGSHNYSIEEDETEDIPVDPVFEQFPKYYEYIVHGTEDNSEKITKINCGNKKKDAEQEMENMAKFGHYKDVFIEEREV